MLPEISTVRIIDYESCLRKSSLGVWQSQRGGKKPLPDTPPRIDKIFVEAVSQKKVAARPLVIIIRRTRVD